MIIWNPFVSNKILHNDITVFLIVLANPREENHIKITVTELNANNLFETWQSSLLNLNSSATTFNDFPGWDCENCRN